MTIELRPEEQELVVQELRPLIAALTGPKHDRYAALAEAVDAGAVGDDAIPALESLLEIALPTGRARRLYRAEGERILTSLFRRTPRGRELAGELDGINQALRVMAGETLDGVTVRMRTLGHFTVTLSAPGTTMTLAVRPDGVAVESVAVGEPRPAGR